MLFAHFSDCHIGGWKEEKLRRLNMDCFREAVRVILSRNVDFVLISGDLFNTALPQIDYIKEVTQEIKKFKDHTIPVYIVAGSHDYSPSGKTMLDVLEKAGLVINVMQFDANNNLLFTIDQKTGAKITGMYGKKGGLEISEYQLLDTKPLEAEGGFKIFMFHTAINEFKPKGMEDMHGADATALPNNFQYYAGGHVHYIFQKQFGNGVLTFPGALFPNNFKELEEWQRGGVYFVDEHVQWEYVPIQLKKVLTFVIDVSHLTPEQATEKIVDEVKTIDVTDCIVTLRVVGDIEGNVSYVDFDTVFSKLASAYIVLKNTAKLNSKFAEQVSVKQGTVEEIEQMVFQEAQKETPLKEINETFTKELMSILSREKGDGEKVADFEHRILSETMQVLHIED